MASVMASERSLTGDAVATLGASILVFVSPHAGHLPSAPRSEPHPRQINRTGVVGRAGLFSPPFFPGWVFSFGLAEVVEDFLAALVALRPATASPATFLASMPRRSQMPLRCVARLVQLLPLKMSSSKRTPRHSWALSWVTTDLIW